MDRLPVNIRVVLVVAQARLRFRNGPISAGVQDDFRATAIFSNRSFHAKRAVVWNRSDLRLVALPNESSERLVGVRLIEIDERRDSLRLRCREALRNLAANGFLFANVFGSLRGGDVLSTSQGWRQKERQ